MILSHRQIKSNIWILEDTIRPCHMVLIPILVAHMYIRFRCPVAVRHKRATAVNIFCIFLNHKHTVSRNSHRERGKILYQNEVRIYTCFH